MLCWNALIRWMIRSMVVCGCPSLTRSSLLISSQGKGSYLFNKLKARFRFRSSSALDDGHKNGYSCLLARKDRMSLSRTPSLNLHIDCLGMLSPRLLNVEMAWSYWCCIDSCQWVPVSSRCLNGAVLEGSNWMSFGQLVPMLFCRHRRFPPHDIGDDTLDCLMVWASSDQVPK